MGASVCQNVEHQYTTHMKYSIRVQSMRICPTVGQSRLLARPVKTNHQNFIEQDYNRASSAGVSAFSRWKCPSRCCCSNSEANRFLSFLTGAHAQQARTVISVSVSVSVSASVSASVSVSVSASVTTSAYLYLHHTTSSDQSGVPRRPGSESLLQTKNDEAFRLLCERVVGVCVCVRA